MKMNWKYVPIFLVMAGVLAGGLIYVKPAPARADDEIDSLDDTATGEWKKPDEKVAEKKVDSKTDGAKAEVKKDAKKNVKKERKVKKYHDYGD